MWFPDDFLLIWNSQLVEGNPWKQGNDQQFRHAQVSTHWPILMNVVKNNGDFCFKISDPNLV